MPRLSPLAAAVASLLLATPALAQEAPATAKEARTLDTLIVTGTRVANRTVAESTAPIDIITPEALLATGTMELATALSRAVPSLNFPRTAITDGSDATRPAQLRGLAPDHTLVLVNGKRYHSGALVNVNGTQGRSSAPADLNTIPISAIERVEVLRDGASAQYGSDAIAGVINIVLKGSDSGGSVSATYGKYSAGDGAKYQLLGDAGFKLGDAGKVHLAAQGGHQDNTNRARPFIGTPTPTSSLLGRVSERFGEPEVDNYSLLFNGELSPADYITFYSHGLHTRRETLSNGFFRAPGARTNIPSIYPNGFLPQIFNTSTDYRLVLGMQSSIGSTNFDASYTFGSNELSFDILNTLNRSLGPTSPTEFHAGVLKFEQHVFNLDFNTALNLGLEYPLTLSYGMEWRGETFTQSPGEPLSYANGGVLAPGESTPRPGAQVFSGFRPSDGGSFDRASASFYAGLEGDLTEKLSAGIAARYENYSDFGSTGTGKLTGRYAFNDAFALRATASTGFHAPGLQQQYFQSTATNFIPTPTGLQAFDIATFRVNHPAATALGAEPLKPEKSKNLSLGLVLTPVEGLYITVDAYRIEVTDRITLSESLTSTAVRNFLNSPAIGLTGVGGGRYFTNAIDTATTGIDIVGTYTWKLDASQIDWTFGYNHNKTEIDRVAPNPAALTAIDPAALRFGRVEIGRFEVGAPRNKLLLGGVWTSDHWEFSTTGTRYGESTLRGANPTLDQTFAAKWTLDLAATYKMGGWNFTIGADNVLNEYPDEVLYINSRDGQLPYDRSTSSFGFAGAFVYGKAGYKW